MNKIVLLCALVIAYPAIAETQSQKLHKKVQEALAWELPVNKCTKPKLLVGSKNVVDGEGAREVTDVDSYTIQRYERREKRWQSCVEKYKDALMVDFEEMKNSAQYGLTKEQADTILKNMAQIQAVYVSPDGMVLAPEPDAPLS